MYKALLVDLDNTLLDFNKAEERALTTTLLRYGLNDTKEIKDPKERKKIEEAKKQVALKKEHKKREFSEKEQQNMEEFYKSIGL